MSEFKFPEFMCAIVASYIGEGEEGDYIRKYTGQIVIKDIIGSCTYMNGLLHSFDDKPAQLRFNKYLIWYKKGLRHRDSDLPAVVSENLTVWYKEGNIHRDGDLPACVEKFKSEWWVNGKKHREADLPAVINNYNNSQEWWKNGIRIK